MRRADDGAGKFSPFQTYLDIRNINVGIVVSIHGTSSSACIVGIDIDGNSLARAIGTAYLKPVFFVLDDDTGTRNILGRTGKGVIIISLILLDLQGVLQISVQKSGNGCDVSSHWFVAALLVTMWINRKDNHIHIITSTANIVR